MKFKLKLSIKNCPTVFIEGEEPGVIASQIASFPDEADEIRVAVALNNMQDKLIEECIETSFEEVQ